jgi:uncharacterized membrane protein YoaK (UPF0700 family)
VDDRAVDRAAGHVSSAQLAVRDWLLAGLSFSTAMYEAICFLALGKVFAGFQSGNLAFLGFGVAGTRPPAGPNPVTVVISLAAFAGGVALAMPILKVFGDDQETSSNVVHAWSRPVSIALAIALILQAAFFGVWFTAASPFSLAYVLVALAAFAMGLQANAVRSLRVLGVSTTAFTATYLDLVSGLATFGLTAPTARRFTATVVSVALGGFLGDWMLGHAHSYAALVPPVVTAVVIAIAWVGLKPRAALSPGKGNWPRPEYRQHRPHGVGDWLECVVIGQPTESGRDLGVDRCGDGIECRGQLAYRVG